jgi:hypothetical protein
VIARNVHANDHHRAGDLVLGLTVRDGLVADGTQLISARTSDDVVIDQWPERSVKESFSDAGEEIHVHCLAPWRVTRQGAAGEALLPLLRGRSTSIGGSLVKNNGAARQPSGDSVELGLKSA